MTLNRVPWRWKVTKPGDETRGFHSRGGAPIVSFHSEIQQSGGLKESSGVLMIVESKHFSYLHCEIDIFEQVPGHGNWGEHHCVQLWSHDSRTVGQVDLLGFRLPWDCADGS